MSADDGRLLGFRILWLRFVLTFRKNVLPPSLVQVDAEVIWKGECVGYVGKFEEILANYGKVRG